MAGPPDFSSQQYWSTRFETETSFEWLARSEVILPVILETVKEVVRARRAADTSSTADSPVKILHFGCGSSSLGSDIHQYLKQNHETNVLSERSVDNGVVRDHSELLDKDDSQDHSAIVNNIIPLPHIEVIDADYVPPTLLSPDTTSRSIPLIQLDVLDQSSLASSSPQEGWDVLIDKSTADAISCGPNVSVPDSSDSTPPLDALLRNLADVTRRGGRWVSVSYSATRYDCLRPRASSRVAPLAALGTGTGIATRNGIGGDATTIDAPRDQSTESGGYGWELVSRTPLGSTAIPEGRLVADGKGFRRVYEPETPIWLYILERV